MCEPCTPDALLEAVRGLRVAEPDLGFKPLLAKLQEQQPELGAATKEVREALKALTAESEAAKAATAQPTADEVVPPAAEEGGTPLHAALSLACISGVLLVPLIPVLAALKAESEAAKAAATALPAANKGCAPSNAALSLACIGCLKLPSDMDDEREKHPICSMCRDEKMPTTYLCGVDCPANPGAWKLHGAFHKRVRKDRKKNEDGGVGQQRDREAAEAQARRAARSGDAYDKLMAEGARYGSKEDWRRAARAYREAIALEPDEPVAYNNLGAALSNSGHKVEAAQRYLEAKERYPVGSVDWAEATAQAFRMLQLEECDEVPKPGWWNDEELKALSARVLRAAPNGEAALDMRAMVLSGDDGGAWAVGPRSAAEFKEAAAHFDRSAALCHAPAWKTESFRLADQCRSLAESL